MSGTKSGSHGRGLMVAAMMMLGAMAGMASGGAGPMLGDGAFSTQRRPSRRAARMETMPDVWGHGMGGRRAGPLCTRATKRTGRTKTCNRRRARYRRTAK
jgi:hypothetical protein